MDECTWIDAEREHISDIETDAFWNGQKWTIVGASRALSFPGPNLIPFLNLSKWNHRLVLSPTETQPLFNVYTFIHTSTNLGKSTSLAVVGPLVCPWVRPLAANNLLQSTLLTMNQLDLWLIQIVLSYATSSLDVEKAFKPLRRVKFHFMRSYQKFT